ncbi:hypothetical protein HMPREF0484_2199, partial [Klebsiella pneumoniae subsp. rhinoscleromatis ATCC 13884]
FYRGIAGSSIPSAGLSLCCQRMFNGGLQHCYHQRLTALLRAIACAPLKWQPTSHR